MDIKMRINQVLNATKDLGVFDINDEDKIRIVVENAGAGNTIVVKARIIGQSSFVTLKTITGTANETVNVSTYEEIKVECTVFDALSSVGVKLLAASFKEAGGSAIESIGVPSGDQLTDISALTFTSSDNSITITGDNANKTIDFTTESAVTSVNGQTGDVVLDKDDIGLGNVDNTSDLDKPISNDTQDVLDDLYANKISILEKGAPNGVAPLNSLSKIDATYLPSYVDDVVEYANLAAFPPTGETGKIYVALDTNKIYRWSGSVYIEISTTDIIAINVENIRYVSKNGNDVTGNGSVNKPYLTITAAQNSIIDASPTKRYGIIVSAGTYTESGVFALKANVFIVGTSRDSVRIGATSFALASDFSGSADNRSGISQATILNNADFNWTTVTSAAGKLYFNETSFSGTINLYGYNNATAQAQFDTCIIFGNFTISGINLGIHTNNTHFGNITMSQHPNGGMATIINASGGSCSGTMTLNATVDDFNRRCSLFAKNFWMNALTINGLRAYADATISSIPKNGATITNNGNLIYIDAGADNRLSNLVAPTAVNASIIPASTNSIYSGDFGKQWFFNFAYVYASSGTDMYLTTYASSFTADSEGRSIYITPDGAGLLSNANSGEILLETAVTSGTGNTGNITLKTGIPSGTGTRGEVLIDASQLDMNSKKIVNLLDPTANQDAATKKYVDDEIAGAVTSVNGQTGDVILDKEDIDLGNVDNTSDLNKPISTATQTALDNKANKNLDNLTATAIPSGVNLESLSVDQGTSATNFSLKTKDQTTSVSGSISVRSGTTDGSFASGRVILESGVAANANAALSTDIITGTGTVASGNITGGTKGTTGNSAVRTGNINTTTSFAGNTGVANLSSGAIFPNANGVTITGNSGNIGIASGSLQPLVSGASVIGNSGSIQSTTGNISTVAGGTVTGNTGNTGVLTGSVLGTGTTTSNTGTARIESGSISNLTNTGNTGNVTVASGNNLATGNSGNVNITTGTVASGTRGKVLFNTREVDIGNVKIVNLSDGTSNNDAVNVSQLNSVLNYSPADNSDWQAPVPDDIKEALDQLADRLQNGTGISLQAFDDMKEPTGFINRTDSTISFDDSTRIFTIAPVAGSFSFYIKGDKFTKTTAQTVTIPDSSGSHYIYFNTSGVLVSTQVFDISIIEQDAYVSLVYWNTDTIPHSRSYFAEERHGITMDGTTHAYLHTVFGARYLSGLALGGFTIGNGTLDSHAQFTSDSGSIRDEDILHIIGAQTQIPILFRQGQLWRKKAADNFPVIYSGSAGYTGANGRLPYNQYTGGAWQLTQVSSNNFVLVHYFATNDVDNKVVGIQGIAQYNNIPDARNAASTEITTLSDLPFTEFVPIGTVIFQTNTYANAIDARIVPVNGANYMDFRGTQLYTPAGEATEHSLLSGLADDDHIQYHTDARGDARYNLKSSGDISETLFTFLTSNQLNQPLVGFAFNNAVVLSFEALASVEIDATNDLFEQFTINGIQKSSNWFISVSSIGDNSQVSFTITSLGQILYTCPTYSGFVSGKIKFRAITTSI
jgi:hypothetical protein